MQVNNMVVGLEPNLTKVKDRLKEARILGVTGMGGIGKTTLANVIFHELKSTYDASYFANKGIRSLPTNLEDAQNMLKQFMVGKKVLIILDDIRDQDQLDNLLRPDILNDNTGITLIITTRHWDKIKDRVRENGKVEVGTLDENAAKELFILHSCGSGGSLPTAFRDIGGRIVKACNGLPLSLVVLGAFLRDKWRLRCWERALRRIKRGRCLDGDQEYEDRRLWSSLRICFDGLGMDEKNMFLDIACFFCKDVWPKGMSIGRALHVWTMNDTPPIKSFNMLIDRSLVNVDRDGHIEMHDQLCDMGRMIVEKDAEYLGTRVRSVDLISSTQSISKV
jgi:energy-coupling factor transporter ATP-binding protein EcfA2